MAMTRPDAVLLDFDGTLADSFDAITASVNRVAGAYGLPPYAEPEVRRLVGYGLGYLLERLFPGHDVERSISIYRENHEGVATSMTRLLPGVRVTLERLHGDGVKMAVCSNKAVRFTRLLCESMGLSHFFDAVLGPEDVAEPKPAPDMLIEAMRRLGVSAGRTLYVGDMTVDVQTARAAGVTVWVIPTGAQGVETLRDASPDRILDRFEEVAGYQRVP